jgi:hypothetical protein
MDTQQMNKHISSFEIIDESSDVEYALSVIEFLTDKINIENNPHLLKKYIECTSKLMIKCGGILNKIETDNQSHEDNFSCQSIDESINDEIVEIINEFDNEEIEINTREDNKINKKRKRSSSKEKKTKKEIKPKKTKQKKNTSKVDASEVDASNDKLKKRKIHVPFAPEAKVYKFTNEKYYENDSFDDIKIKTLIFYFKYVSYCPSYFKKCMPEVLSEDNCIEVITNFDSILDNEDKYEKNKGLCEPYFHVISELLKTFYKFQENKKTGELAKQFTGDFPDYLNYYDEESYECYNNLRDVYILVNSIVCDKIHKHFVMDCASAIADNKFVCGGFSRNNLKFLSKSWWIKQIEDIFNKHVQENKFNKKFSYKTSKKCEKI